MQINQRLDLFKDVLDGFYRLRIEDESHETDEAAYKEIAVQICQLAREAKQQIGEPVRLNLEVETDDGEIAILRLSLDYQKVKVR